MRIRHQDLKPQTFNLSLNLNLKLQTSSLKRLSTHIHFTPFFLGGGLLSGTLLAGRQESNFHNRKEKQVLGSFCSHFRSHFPCFLWLLNVVCSFFIFHMCHFSIFHLSTRVSFVLWCGCHILCRGCHFPGDEIKTNIISTKVGKRGSHADLDKLKPHEVRSGQVKSGFDKLRFLHLCI